jgi:spoIIIJ-associated protein
MVTSESNLMKQLEVSAKSVEEATRQALDELGLTIDQVNIEVLNEGKGGVLGIGAEEARIRVTYDVPPRSDIDTLAENARTTLENLLYYMGLQANVSAQIGESVEDGGTPVTPVVFDIQGQDLAILIGRRGQTLSCLQYILRLMTGRQPDCSTEITLDVNGYKKRRYESLRTLAQHIAEQVEVNGRSFALEPMPAYERRIIHLALAEHPYVTTESVGFGDARKVVVLPRNQ